MTTQSRSRTSIGKFKLASEEFKGGVLVGVHSTRVVFVFKFLGVYTVEYNGLELDCYSCFHRLLMISISSTFLKNQQKQCSIKSLDEMIKY